MAVFSSESTMVLSLSGLIRTESPEVSSLPSNRDGSSDSSPDFPLKASSLSSSLISSKYVPRVDSQPSDSIRPACAKTKSSSVDS